MHIVSLLFRVRSCFSTRCAEHSHSVPVSIDLVKKAAATNLVSLGPFLFLFSSIMATRSKKIVKERGLEADEFEESVGQVRKPHLETTHKQKWCAVRCL